MRLLKYSARGRVSLTSDLVNDIPAYAILSHTWGAEDDEVTFDDLKRKRGKKKVGWGKIRFCGEQARQHGLQYIWVDTCCINKANHAELSEAITSMYRWYRDAVKCYAYLSDVSAVVHGSDQSQYRWESAFHNSQWFTRGWTLQELLAPASVEFFSQEGRRLGCKKTLQALIHEITKIPVLALQGEPLSHFSVDERLRWTIGRKTRKVEDRSYCLLGIFNIFMPLMYGEGENAFQRLREEISKRSQASAASSAHEHWVMIRSRNPLFTGRDAILQELHRTVCDAVQYPQTDKQCRIVISGMGGQGKSEICLQFAHRQRQSFWRIFWIDVSTTGQAERSFLNIAHKLSLSTGSWEDARLSIANLKSPWLLVLDNADDPDRDYQQYFPDSPLGVVMLTSRNHECQQYATAKPITLEGLSDEAARELLLKAAGTLDQHNVLDEDAKTVAGLLQAHPLALIQAGAYIGRGHCTLAEYPRRYEQQRQQLLQFRSKQAQSRYRDVYATFEVSAAMLTTSGTETAQDALQLLSLLAVCGPNRLPLALFEAAWKGAKRVPLDMNEYAEDDEVRLLTPWHIAHLPSLLVTTSDIWEPFRLVEAVSLLKAFSLVSTDNHDGHLSVSTHPLIHAWARDRQDHIGRHKSWLQMGCVIALISDEDALWRVYERQLQSHVEALTMWEVGTIFKGESSILVARILVNCGWLLDRMRADTKLYMLLMSMYSQLKLDRIKVKQSWLGFYSLTARNFIYYGKLREAVALLEKVVKIREQSLAEDHPHRLISQQELASAYKENGQVKEAVALLEKVAKIHKQSLAEDHPDQLASQHELARAYRANGQAKEAVALLEKVVKIDEQSLAEDHPDRLDSQHELASAYEANEQVMKAVALLKKVVKIREQSLAEDHPDRLASQHALASAYQANGQVKQAVALLEKVVKIREQSLAEDHPDRLKSQHELASAFRANGQVKKAVALLKKVVKIWEQSLPENHPSRLKSLHNLSTYIWELGNYETAIEVMTEVVKLRQQVLDENHPDRQASEKWLCYFHKRI